MESIIGEHQICDLPWGQLYVSSAGQVFPCNFLQNQVSLGDIATRSLIEIWRGPEMAAFREAHRAGRQGDCSDRQKRYFCYLLHRDLGTSQQAMNVSAIPKYPKRLDVMVDSACNLKCVMCTNIFEPSGGLKNEHFWTANDELWQNLEELEVVGGEPLLSRHFYRLANIVSSSNPGCRWRMTTNAAYPIRQELKEILLRLRIQTFAMSIDSLDPKTFETIRVHSNFKKIVANVDQFCELLGKRPETTLAISFLIQKLNAFELPDLFPWAAARGARLNFTLLRAPSEFSIFEWPEEERERLVRHYSKANESLYSLRLSHLIKRIFDSLSSFRKLELAEVVARNLADSSARLTGATA